MAETARLGDLQRDTIIRLRDLYLRNVGILARRRKQLTAALQVTTALHEMLEHVRCQVHKPLKSRAETLHPAAHATRCLASLRC